MIDFGLVSIFDFLTIILFFFIFFYGYKYFFKKTLNNENKEISKLFSIALFLKLLFSVLYKLIFLYYYGYGDTLAYYREASALHKFLANNPLELFNIYSLNGSNYYDYFLSHGITLNSVSEYYNYAQVKVIQFGSVASIFTCNSVFAMSMMFGLVAFTGNWFFYKLFIEIFPSLTKKTLFGLLFLLPSIIFWANGVSKDSLIYGFSGILVYLLHQLFISREIKIYKIILSILLSFWIFNIKPYILFITVPSFLLFVFLYYLQSVKSFSLRLILKLVLFCGIVGSIFILRNKIAENLQSLFIESFIEQSTIARKNLINDSGDDGSSFDIGKIEPTIQGVAIAIPKCINATFFRPYIWESKKVITLFSAVESLFMLLLFIYVLLKLKIYYFFKALFNSPFLMFGFSFSILLAILIGLTTSNFGTLVRYKMPILPYFVVILYGIYNSNIKKVNNNNI